MAPSATDLLSRKSESEKEYPSGDPDLTLPADVPRGPPLFDDKYEERKYLKHRLALAFRVFAKFGFAEGVAGHITLRDPVDPTSFWVNPFGTLGYPQSQGLRRFLIVVSRPSLLSHHRRRPHPRQS
jgi:hypothetical protein